MRGILAKIEGFLEGYKTYIVAIPAGIAVALELIGIEIPWQIVGPILAALGLGAVRSAIGKVEKDD